MTGSGAAHWGGGGTQSLRGTSGGKNPRGRHVTGCRSRAAKGGRRTQDTAVKNLAHGVGRRPSSGGWQVAGVGDVQVDRVPFRGNRWG